MPILIALPAEASAAFDEVPDDDCVVDVDDDEQPATRRPHRAAAPSLASALV